ncbi:MAG: hypothetical protein NC314_03190 [Roseburia sp.]|nr:hypothetical protein [Roseburia sp.]MCM1241818.1 hypothetical protein [Roseburia sp.]
MKKKHFIILPSVILTTLVIAGLVITKKIRITPVLADRFEMTDGDVSRYQGGIGGNVFRGTKEELAEMPIQSAHEEVSLEQGNLIYDTEQVKVFSFLGQIRSLYIITPNEERVISPVQRFWLDKEQETVWLLESQETIQIRKIDLSEAHFLEETLILDAEEMETLLLDTYQLFMEEKNAFWDLKAGLSGQEQENGEFFLGGSISGICKANGKKYEIFYEIDRENDNISVKGYLQDLALPPLYQEFLLHNLTAESLLTEKNARFGESLSFFDDEIYLSQSGEFGKQFAIAEDAESGEPVFFFRLQQVDGNEEYVYVLTEENGGLVCREIFDSAPASWFDCASFMEIPAKNCQDYKSREEVFATVENGDFSVIADNYADSGMIPESLEMDYESESGTGRFERCDIDGDGFDELIFLIKYDTEDFWRIAFILDYRNGRAVCVYYDWCDGNEWLALEDAGKLIHCSYSNNGSCTYYGFYECSLDARGIKDLDFTGYGLEMCDVYEDGDAGLWWWNGQRPEITQSGIYYTRVRAKNAEETAASGTTDGWVKELIAKEEFTAAYEELLGKAFK